MDVRLPDGTVIQNVPEGTTKADLVAKLQKNGMDVPKEWMGESKPSLPETTAGGAFARGALKSAAPTAAGIAAFPQGAAAGATVGSVGGPVGSAIGGVVGGLAASIGAGYVMNKAQDKIAELIPESLKERLGLGKSIEQADKEQHPLASMAGEIAPQAAFLRPGAVSAAQTALGGSIGAGAELTRELVNKEEIDWKKMLLAGAAGATLQKTTKLGQKVGLPTSSSGKSLTAEQEVKNQNVEKAYKAGYTIPPTQANPSMVNKASEGFSGKIQTAQKASEKNQVVTNNLAKKSIGLPEDAPITPEALDQVRKEAGKAYERISKRGTDFVATPEYKQKIQDLDKNVRAATKEFPELAGNKEIEILQKSLDKQNISPQAAVELTKQLRADSKANLKNYQDPGKVALGRAQQKASDAIESLIEQNLAKSKDTKQLQEFRAARKLIAKTYTIEDALNETTGNVSARKIGGELGKGKPLSGELKDIAQFARAFPKAAQDVEKIGSQPGFSPLDVATGVIAGAATGNPYAAAAIGARPAVREIILSRPFQRFAVKNGVKAAAEKFKVPLSAIVTQEREKDNKE